MMVMLQRFWVQLTSDRKRFGLLCAALAAGLLLWARLIIVSKVPRTAVAEPLSPVTSEQESPRAEGEADSDNAVRPPLVLRVSADNARDPFLINREFFPKTTSIEPAAEEAGKSSAEPVENPEQVRSRDRALLLAHVERLKLEAVMTGHAMAVISGRLYRLNDMVPALNNPAIQFKLADVRTRSVVLAHDEFVFEVKMDSPEAGSP